jgi:hypothetical protein
MLFLHKWEKCKLNSKKCSKMLLIRNSKILKNKSKKREFSLDSIIYQTVTTSWLLVMMFLNNIKRKLINSKRKVESLISPIAFNPYKDSDKTVKSWFKGVSKIYKKKKPMTWTQELLMVLNGLLWHHQDWINLTNQTSKCINKKLQWQHHRMSRHKRDLLTSRESFKFWHVPNLN